MAAWSERTSADVSGLLVELGRVLKGTSFYGPADATTRGLTERAYRAWRVDLDRAGPLDLHLTTSGFQADGIRQSISTAHLSELTTALRSAGVESLHFGDGLSADSLLAFATSLPKPPEIPKSPLAPQPGIEINGRSHAPTSESAAHASEGPQAPRTSLLSEQIDRHDDKPSIERSSGTPIG